MIDLTNEPLDFQEYEDNIGAYGNINYMDKERLNKSIAMAEAISKTCDKHMKDQLRYICGGFNTTGTSIQKVKEIFKEHGIPAKYFKSSTTVSGESFNAEIRDEVKNYLITTSHTRDDFFNMLNYMIFMEDNADNKSTVSSVRKPMEEGLIIDCDIKGFGGISLYAMRNVYKRRKTGRYYASEVAIVQLPEMNRNSITVPEDYFMLGVDLHQIDMRVGYNMYLRGRYKEEDLLFDNEKKDKYKAMYEIVCKKYNMPSDMELFTENRGEIKTCILAGMYGAQIQKLQSVLNNIDVNKAIVNYFKTHELYQEQCDKIQRLYNLDVPFIVRDFFGFEIDIEITVKDENGISSVTKLQFEKVCDYVFSRTIQSTSNSIVVLWTNYIIRAMREEGVDESNLWINMVRHDEIVFTIHKDVIDKLDKLYDALSIRISDWGDITFQPEVYIHYGDKEGSLEGEQEELDTIKNKLDCLYSKEYEYVPQVPRLKNKCIPTVNELYVFSPLEPRELLKTIIGKKVNTNDEAVQIIAELADNKSLFEEFREYKDTYDIFIIKNITTGRERMFKGLNRMSEVLDIYSQEYIQINTVYGIGMIVLGNCFASYDCTEKGDTIRELGKAIRGEIKVGDV